MPVLRNAFEIERREFSLEFVCEREIKPRRLAGLAMAQGGLRFSRIVVAIMIEEKDLAADFRMQSPGRLDFCKQEPPRKKSARLLTEANDGRRHHDVASALAGGLVGPST